MPYVAFKFAQLFTQIVGEPPLAYLQQHRLRLAAQYLRNSGFSIQQIAYLVGYSSETAFSQSFKNSLNKPRPDTVLPVKKQDAFIGLRLVPL